jgi:carboxyl-terminal processing protease
VIPDIVYPSGDEPDEYGESALDNALPWTRIAPVDYRGTDRYRELLPRLQALHGERVSADEEFGFLRDDIEDYRQHRDDVYVSLLEAERRADMEQAEARREARRKLRASRIDEIRELDLEVAAQVAAAETGTDSPDDEALDDADASAREEQADLFLDEASRIAADLALLIEEGRPLADRARVVTMLAQRAEQAAPSTLAATGVARVEPEPPPEG